MHASLHASGLSYCASSQVHGCVLSLHVPEEKLPVQLVCNALVQRSPLLTDVRQRPSVLEGGGLLGAPASGEEGEDVSHAALPSS